MKGRDRGHVKTIIHCSLYGDKFFNTDFKHSFKMNRTCPLESRNNKDFTIESLQSQKTLA